MKDKPQLSAEIEKRFNKIMLEWIESQWKIEQAHQNGEPYTRMKFEADANKVEKKLKHFLATALEEQRLGYEKRYLPGIPTFMWEELEKEKSDIAFSRCWAMPSKNTFSIKPITKIIEKYRSDGIWLDPFPFPYKQDAIEYLQGFDDVSVDGILFDPPYSPRQLKECYDSLGMVLHDTKSSVWKSWKDQVARVIKKDGLCLSFGWSTNGLGKNRGFKIVEILMVAHGGNHNDTLVTVERKL